MRRPEIGFLRLYAVECRFDRITRTTGGMCTRVSHVLGAATASPFPSARYMMQARLALLAGEAQPDALDILPEDIEDL